MASFREIPNAFVFPAVVVSLENQEGKTTNILKQTGLPIFPVSPSNIISTKGSSPFMGQKGDVLNYPKKGKSLGTPGKWKARNRRPGPPAGPVTRPVTRSAGPTRAPLLDESWASRWLRRPGANASRDPRGPGRTNQIDGGEQPKNSFCLFVCFCVS